MASPPPRSPSSPRPASDALAPGQGRGRREDQIAVLERELDARKRITDAQIRMAKSSSSSTNRPKDQRYAGRVQQAGRPQHPGRHGRLPLRPFARGTQGMLQSFGTMLQKMIAQPWPPTSASAYVRRPGQGAARGSGWFGGALDWLGGPIQERRRRRHTSAGLAAYSGRIVDRPTVFPSPAASASWAKPGRGHPAPQARRRRRSASRRAVAATPSTSRHRHQRPDVRRANGQGRLGSPGRVERSPPLWLSSWRSACRSGPHGRRR